MHALKTPPGAPHFACSTLFLGLAVWVMAGTPLSMNAQPKYTIAYSGFAPLNTDIFIADADGRNPKPFLASLALDFNASFSRDGRWIVFTSERNGSADIYRAHVDGTGLEQLTNDPPLTIRPLFHQTAARWHSFPPAAGMRNFGR